MTGLLYDLCDTDNSVDGVAEVCFFMPETLCAPSFNIFGDTVTSLSCDVFLNIV